VNATSQDHARTLGDATASPPEPRSIVADRHAPRDFYLRRVLALADGVGFVAALMLTYLMTGYSAPTWKLLLLAVVMVPVWIAICGAYGLYTKDMQRISHTTVDDLPGLFHALLVGTILLWVLSRLLPGDNLVFKSLAAGALMTGFVTLLVRTLVRRFAPRFLGPERLLVIGSSSPARLLVEKLQRQGTRDQDVVGALTGPENARWPLPLPNLGALDVTDLEAIVREQRVDRVVIAAEHPDSEEMLEMMRMCKHLSVKVSLLPALFSVMGHSTQVDEVEGLTLLSVNPPVLSRSARWAKRSMDVVGAGFGLVLLSPLLIVIAVAIRFDSRGPVLFRQERVGREGRRFRIAKFRSMAVDAEQRREALLGASKDPNWLHLEHDPRITRVGGFLRRTSLDELPQLWNVLRGDMSLVGPRPLIGQEDARVDGWDRGRLSLTPGVTGLWQVLGRTTIPFEEMVKLDYAYVTNWSLWGDVRLILRTIPAVLSQRGSN